jgi:hypothetical protein
MPLAAGRTEWEITPDRRTIDGCIRLLQDAAVQKRGNAVPAGEEGVRVTATITRQHHRLLRALAARHKVSVAWLIRHAIDRLLSEGESVQLPLDLGS